MEKEKNDKKEEKEEEEEEEEEDEEEGGGSTCGVCQPILVRVLLAAKNRALQMD